MQKWEYKTLYRGRNAKMLGRVSDWGYFKEDGHGLPEPHSWATWLGHVKRLGEDGWELVQIVPHASYATLGQNGFTSDELWVFKRPEP